MMFRCSLVEKFGMFGIVAIAVAGSIFLFAEPSQRLSLNDTEEVTKIEPKAAALTKVESSSALAATPPVNVEIPTPTLVKPDALAACECQGDCGFAEQMRQSEP
jgi:hypothetical protein